MRVTKQSGENTVAIAEAVRAEIERINREVPNVQLTVLDDSSIFIERSIAASRRPRYLGAFLVVLIIFLFLRNLRSTFIICTSIPISIIGTFALLYFAGFTLNTMTFGGLALGVGMIVDASIVVLENSFRHMEHRQGPACRRPSTAARRSGRRSSRPSSRTSPVFVPLLFLTGVSSILFKQLADRRHVLAGDVAVRRGDARAGALLAAARAAAARRTAARPRGPAVHAGASAC